MKKFFTLMSVAAMSAMAMAQGVTTHSVYDVNQNGEINVADAVSVAQATLQEADPTQTQQYVTGEDLSTMFSTILTKLESLEARMTALENKKCDCSGAEGDGGTGNGDGNNPATGLYNGHEYVDLGVVVDGKPVYWATTNVGAKIPGDYGLYFAWGETMGHTNNINDGRIFDYANYSSDLCGGAHDKMKKYCTNSSYGTIDKKTVLDPDDDAAHVEWLGSWRMPTKEELDALREQCSWTWTTMKNSEEKSVYGYKVSNKSDSSKYIFLPAAGLRFNNSIRDEVLSGSYWSSSLHPSDNYYAYFIDFNSSSYKDGDCPRCYGLSIRPVCQ